MVPNTLTGAHPPARRQIRPTFGNSAAPEASGIGTALHGTTPAARAVAKCRRSGSKYPRRGRSTGASRNSSDIWEASPHPRPPDLTRNDHRGLRNHPRGLRNHPRGSRRCQMSEKWFRIPPQGPIGRRVAKRVRHLGDFAEPEAAETGTTLAATGASRQTQGVTPRLPDNLQKRRKPLLSQRLSGLSQHSVRSKGLEPPTF